MKPTNILIVEDEKFIALELKKFVTELGYYVTHIVDNGDDALLFNAHTPNDIVLMDIHIKGQEDGIQTAKKLKEQSPHIYIIFLTSHMKDYDIDRAIPLDPIAYLSKACNRQELHIFLKIADNKIRNNYQQHINNPDIITLDEEFYYHKESSMLYCCDVPLHLTGKELALLKLFMQHINQIVDMYTIEASIWPQKETINANTIRTLVKRLRQKLKHKFIETLSLQGYKFSVSPVGTI
ncbi:MAG: Two-component hybrid sensor and regulator [uncultured Sulfurovum sp.]|uniref:Two-component hybrid sensor and regulator n=1 Tax=uncultured Sulfurovum sp. TaxID=269237 RepID=A0A6S6U0S3_9BACT|nr:MAG: Two-component hybrid sensor and regulator [uncultured Sulfurovum sp.]